MTDFNTTFANEAEEDRILAKIEKMLRMAEGNANENEASTAMLLAQQLADAYNIDIEGVRGKGSDPKARHDDLFSGGLYAYQRSLYKAIADLNHCLYWARKGLRAGQKYQHRLVGSKVNVLMSKQMGDYLQGAVERLARDYVDNDPKRYFTKEAHVFREGVVDRVVDKIRNKRADDIAAAKAKREAEKARGDGTSLVLIDDVIEREKAANYDFQYGEGAWARAMADRAEREARQRAANEATAKWEAENPEAAALRKAQEAEELAKYYRDFAKKEARKAARRKAPINYNSRPTKYDHDAYWHGQDAGKNVSLDRQVEQGAKGGLLK